MENIMHEHIKQQLEQHQQILIEKDQKLLFDKEKTLLEAYHKKPVVYGGEVEENLEKFGWSDDIKTRVDDHKRDYGTFKLDFVIECDQNIELEKKMSLSSEHNWKRIITIKTCMKTPI